MRYLIFAFFIILSFSLPTSSLHAAHGDGGPYCYMDSYFVNHCFSDPGACDIARLNDLPVVSAQCTNVSPGPNPSEPSPGDPDGGTRLRNPLGDDTNTLWDFFDRAMEFLVIIAIPIIVLFTVFAGFRFVTAGGNQEKLSGAKKTFMYVIIGTAIILSARLIAVILKATFDSITG